MVDKFKANLNTSAADVLTENIRNLILSGELKPGYEFPHEEEFCKELGVSRGTLREAYKALETSGYIKRVKGHGTIVSELSQIMEAAPFGEKIRLVNLVELMEFREMIETEATRFAALRATKEDIEVLEEVVKMMAQNMEDITKFDTYNVHFHMQIAYASKNPLLISSMKPLEDSISRGVFSAFRIDTPENMSEAIVFHKNILEAVKNKDVEKAGDSMRSHLQSVTRRVSKTK